MSGLLPLVSVIIPVYRFERFVSEALASVRAQSWGGWEILVVEDAAEERTEPFVREFAKGVCQKVTYLRHDRNRGVAAARNTAARNARGAYLAFLDADDLWKETHLENSLKRLEEEKADLAYTTALIFEDGTNRTVGYFGPREKELDHSPLSFYLRNFIPISAVVMRRKLIQRIGFFDEKIECGDDLDYWMRCALGGIKFVHARRIDVLRRKHPQAMTQNELKWKEGKAHFYRKYLKLAALPLALRRLETAKSHVRVGALNLFSHPSKAARFFSYAWKIWSSLR